MDGKKVLYIKDNDKKRRVVLKLGPPKAKQEEQPMKTGYIGYVGQMPVMHMNMNVQQQGDDKKSELLERWEEVIESARKLKINAIKIPEIESPPPEEQLKTDDLKVINIKYPLIPQNPRKGERIFAYAHIFFDQKTGEIVYNVIEPVLSTRDKIVLNEIKEFIQEKLDINFAQIRKADAAGYISDIFNKAISYFKIKGDVEVLKYYVIRDFIGLELLEPLVQDKNIEDISCDGINIPIYIYHRDTKLGSLRTNIMFTRGEDLDYFVSKLAERTGKNISVAKPLLDGTLPDGSRIQATLGSDIARHGSNFTIRMFTEQPLTPTDMIISGTADLKMLAYLWLLVEHEASILIAGGTASGKTTLLNVLSLFIKPQLKIVSIEDTSELRLPHAHWIPEVARSPISDEGKVDMFELLRESLRQRPDYIIVGEVRGKEAYVLFQQMAVGHAGLATIHAENFPKLLDRLTTAPINLPVTLIQNLDCILFIRRVKRGRFYSRRISEAVEILGYNSKNKDPIIHQVMKWEPKSDVYTTTNKSALLRKIADNTGMTEEDIQNEIIERSKVLEWIAKHNIRDYRKFASIINLYYFSPDFLLNKIEGGL